MVVVVAAAGLAGCQADPSNAGCGLTLTVAQTGSPLTLLAHPELDFVVDHFVLIGADDGGFVRWATIDPASGQLGSEQALAVPPHEGGPWYAMAGQHAPGDTVLLAYSLSAPNNVDSQIVVQAAPVDGSAPPSGPTVVATIVGAAGTVPDVATGSSRLGNAGAFAWIDAGNVKARVVTGAGQPTGTVITAGTAASPSCLSFLPGKDELTLGFYLAPAAGGSAPAWLISELRESGNLDSTLSLPFAAPGVSCPLQTATVAGYTLAWQDGQGSWLGTYDAGTNRLNEASFATAVSFGGANVQPPLVGLASLGSDYGVILAKTSSAELWRLGSGGLRHPGALDFPSALGNLGGISALPFNGSLYATYADYTATAAGVGTAGQRYFVEANCE